MPRFSRSLFAACLGLAGLVLACSSSSSSGATATPCNDAPFECPTGQTCWPNSNGTGFECLNSAAGVAVGATCTDTVGAPTCGDAQLCYQASASAAGECLSYCDPSSTAHGCAAGATCRELEFANDTSLTTFVCVAPTVAADSGAPDASSTDSASAVDSSTTDATAD